MAPLKKARIDPPMATTPFEMWPGAQGFSIYERNGRKRLTLTGGHDEQNKTLGHANINRYFEVGTINRINRLKPINCSTKFNTVALIEFAIRNLPVKAHLKKNPEAEKLDGDR
jgi:hypothetical protein